MATGTIHTARYGEAWEALTALIAIDGSGRHPHAAALAGGAAGVRDLTDAVHCLCMLHGRHPGVIDVAAERASDVVAEAWLAEAAAMFAEERAAVVALVAAAGPLPSTPGQAETEAAIAAQRHAMDMIAMSDRAGCPVGATMALLLDWPAIRTVLDAAADRLGRPARALALPTARDSATVIGSLAATPAFERAMLFGAQQMLAQHRALWDVLDARAKARASL